MSRISVNKQTGDATELLVAYWLTRCGITVCWPFGDRGQYDLIATTGGKPYRVQCKTGVREWGSLTWSCISHGSNANHNYRGAADLFGVSDLLTGKTYLVPVCTCGVRRATLRIDPLRGDRKLQALGWAADYEINEQCDLSRILSAVTPPGDDNANTPREELLRVR